MTLCPNWPPWHAKSKGHFGRSPKINDNDECCVVTFLLSWSLVEYDYSFQLTKNSVGFLFRRKNECSVALNLNCFGS